MGLRSKIRLFRRMRRYQRESRDPNRLRVVDKRTTMDELLKHEISLARFGDGEIKVIRGMNINFQKSNEPLVRSLKEVAASLPSSQLRIAIPSTLTSLDGLTREGTLAHCRLATQYRPYWRSVFRSDCTYLDTEVSRPYIDWQDENEAAQLFDDWKTLWRERHIVMVEGSFTRAGVGNDFFAHCASVQRIIAPARSAFTRLPEIISYIQDNVPKDHLILAALGPTAVPLAWQLSSQGYRCLDIGHLDIEYEWFMRRSRERVNIPGKFTNEAKGEEKTRGEIDLSDYNRQIIGRFDD